MTEKWLTTQEASRILNLSYRHLKRLVKLKKMKIKVVEGNRGGGIAGKKYLVALSSINQLSPAENSPSISPPYKAGNASCATLAACTDRQRQEAFRRLSILQQWQEFAKDEGKTRGEIRDEYVQVILENGISSGTLKRWRKDHAESGILGLVPKWSNGREAFSPEDFSLEAKDRAKQFYLHQNRISFKAVYMTLRKESRIKDWKIPSYVTVKRYLQTIPMPAVILLREGRKKFADMAVPSILRNIENLAAMEIIESDHHQLDIAAVDHRGNVFFPWLTIWYDVRSRRPLSWIITSQPNADTVNISLMRTIREFGIPAAVHIDNGKDYRAKIFRGEKGRYKADKSPIDVRLNSGFIEGIYGQLGIKVHWALPYNAKTKVIERFFQTLRREFSVWYRGYRGKNTMEKPDNLKRKMSSKDLVPFDECKLHLDRWMHEYCHARPHKTLHDQVPDRVFQDNRIPMRTVADEELMLLCSQYPRMLKVGKNGIYFFNDFYWSEKLACDHLGEQVYIRYAEDNPAKIYAFDQAGKYICSADKRNPGTWKMDADEYRRHMRMKKVVLESTMPYQAIVAELPDKDREELFVSLLPKEKVQLPEVPVETIETPWRVILEQEKRTAAERKHMEEKVKDFESALAQIEVGSEKKRLEREADEFLSLYKEV